MTEIIDRSARAEIGTERRAAELKRGDHVRLQDGRWALLLEAPTRGLAIAGSDRYGASVCINQRHTEGASWRWSETVFSRTPEEQMRHVEQLFASMKPSGGAR